ncbi:MAG TPA: serine/threonine-protein kinase, partial [Kofleriaceae bacterium]|nr:serine/threonine-protein kinase [Kofleriaceae bacterium]
MLTDNTDPLIGTMLGKNYRVIEPIGMGGMAVVYLVEHQTLLKRFAAKVLSPALASSMEARARFTQEAHAASQLDHENIVSITDFGVTHDQRPFFVMELLRGQTLDERLSNRPMALEEVVAVAVPVARALSHAHHEGIVHLDVKPENIFLTQRSQGRWGVKVVDFGISKTPLNPRLAKPEETAGSPMFMAPEVCRGDDDVDQRADVYSFGILLYLMMCGRLPFVHDNLHRVLQMQLVQLPAPPRELNAELSPELAAIVERALAKERDDRYPSMEALLLDFEASLPPGADRLLIEAQFGTAEPAFAAASNRIARPSQPPPISTAGLTPGSMPSIVVPRTLSDLHAAEHELTLPSPEPFDDLQAIEPTKVIARPMAPQRRGATRSILLGSAVAALLVGAIAVRKLALDPASAGEGDTAAVAVATTSPAAKPAEPAAAEPAAAEPAP